jgi:hypothetical protein
MSVVTLVLGVSVFLWSLGDAAADRYQGSEHYEGYGPIDESLRVNNPLIPEPIGPRLLRDNIPGVADEMQRWPTFFRDLELNLHHRSYYFNRELPIRPSSPSGPDTFNQEAWALGGWVGLKSGWLLDTFRAGATGYTSQPAYAPEDRDGTGLLAPGQNSIDVVGQAFASSGTRTTRCSPGPPARQSGLCQPAGQPDDPEYFRGRHRDRHVCPD